MAGVWLLLVLVCLSAASSVTLHIRCEVSSEFVCSSHTFPLDTCLSYCTPCLSYCDVGTYVKLSGESGSYQLAAYSDEACERVPEETEIILCGDCIPASSRYAYHYQDCTATDGSASGNQWRIPLVVAVMVAAGVIAGVIAALCCVRARMSQSSYDQIIAE